jgi:hypothetical protein
MTLVFFSFTSLPLFLDSLSPVFSYSYLNSCHVNPTIVVINGQAERLSRGALIRGRHPCAPGLSLFSPNVCSWLEFLELHLNLKGKPLARGVDLEVIAKQT